MNEKLNRSIMHERNQGMKEIVTMYLESGGTMDHLAYIVNESIKQVSGLEENYEMYTDDFIESFTSRVEW